MDNKITKEFADKYMVESVDEKTVEVELFGKKVNLKISNHCKIADKPGIARDVETFCFDDDGAYVPNMFEFAFRYVVALYLTDLFSNFEEVDAGIVDYVLFQTSVYDEIARNVDGIKQLRNSVLEYIDYRKNRSNWEDVAKAIADWVKNLHTPSEDDMKNIALLASSLSKLDEKEVATKIVDYEAVRGLFNKNKSGAEDDSKPNKTE